jgi:hypothetical protein
MTRVAVPDFMTYPPPFLRASESPGTLVTEKSEDRSSSFLPLLPWLILFSSPFPTVPVPVDPVR